jgi:putative ABC transport system ATP-binding protein
MSIIEIKNLTKSFVMGNEEIKAIDNVDFKVEKGEFVSIIGPSGSGKSTLMNVLGLLDVPDSGEYYLDGLEVDSLSDNKLAELRSTKIGFIFQSFNLLPKLDALENVELPLMYQGIDKYTSEDLAYEYLEKVGLKGREKHLPTQLSGRTATKSSNSKSISK